MRIDSAREQLVRIDRQRRTLERRIRLLEQKKLATLPQQFGLPDVDSLIFALTWHASSPLRSKLHAVGIGIDEPAANEPLEEVEETVREAGNRRARFTPELRTRIREELELGQKTATELSREYGPSLSTVMGWKRQWGLTRSRAKQVSGEH